MYYLIFTVNYEKIGMSRLARKFTIYSKPQPKNINNALGNLEPSQNLIFSYRNKMYLNLKLLKIYLKNSLRDEFMYWSPTTHPRELHIYCEITEAQWIIYSRLLNNSWLNKQVGNISKNYYIPQRIRYHGCCDFHSLSKYT